MLGDEERILREIARLEDEHKQLDGKLARARNLCQLEIQRMKRRKLFLKDEIARLEDELCPDIIA